MKTKAASTRTEGLLALFDLQTDFLKRALEGISKEDMHKRLDTPANHMAYLAGALVAQRYIMTTETQPGLKQTGYELFENNKGIQKDAEYPSNETYLSDWEMITPLAREAFASLEDAKLDSILDMGGMKMTWFEMVTFTMYREASMIGQLALWRRLLGYPPLNYG